MQKGWTTISIRESTRDLLDSFRQRTHNYDTTIIILIEKARKQGYARLIDLILDRKTQREELI